MIQDDFVFSQQCLQRIQLSTMKQREIIFYSEGTKMVGDIYLPDDYKESERRPGIIANSGWTGMTESLPA